MNVENYVYDDISEVLKRIEDELDRIRNRLSSASNIRAGLYKTVLFSDAAKEQFNQMTMPDGTIGLLPRGQQLSFYRGEYKDRLGSDVNSGHQTSLRCQ